jgi:transketolase
MAGDANFRRELGQQLRVDSVRASAAAGSGHPTSSMSAADLMAVLLDGHLKLDFQNPKNPANDHSSSRRATRRRCTARS